MVDHRHCFRKHCSEVHVELSLLEMLGSDEFVGKGGGKNGEGRGKASG